MTTEHPAVMMERLLQEKHNLILDNERMRAAFLQIVHVCDDNASKNCNKAMALVFVREVAATAIINPHNPRMDRHPLGEELPDDLKLEC